MSRRFRVIQCSLSHRLDQKRFRDACSQAGDLLDPGEASDLAAQPVALFQAGISGERHWNPQ
jgi:hypothetical protein